MRRDAVLAAVVLFVLAVLWWCSIRIAYKEGYQDGEADSMDASYGMSV